MNIRQLAIGRILLCGCALLLVRPAALAQWATQTVRLQSGWNAVYLWLTPYPSACDQAFAGQPVTDVFTSNIRNRTAQFDTDPTRLFQRPDEWLTWTRSAGDSSYVRTLVNLAGDRAYLMRATNDCVLTLKGRPVIPRLEWVPGRANLAGFQVSLAPELQPTFAEFFRYEPAIDGSQDFAARRILQVGPALESINLTGQTTRRTIAPGRAYWIQAQTLSTYIGPVTVAASDPNGLVFGEDLNELTLQIRNALEAGAPPLTITVRHARSDAPPPGAPAQAGAPPLLFLEDNAPAGAWRPWPVEESQNWSLASGQLLSLRFALNRAAMSAPASSNALWQSLLQVSGSGGTFIQVPVSAAYTAGNDLQAPFPYGLWVGEANLTEASYAGFDTNAQAEVTTGPLPVRGSFPLRLILHAGSDRSCRLLSSALVAAMPDATSNVVNRLYSSAAQVPAGATILTRISSAAFGRQPPIGLTGAGFLSALEGSFTIDYDDPLNPFKHVYHPDHNNRGADGAKLAEGQESFSISNRVQFTWTRLPNPDLGAAFWRPDETVTGSYVHTISNLRHTPIVLRGEFTLKRVSRVGRIE